VTNTPCLPIYLHSSLCVKLLAASAAFEPRVVNKIAGVKAMAGYLQNQFLRHIYLYKYFTHNNSFGLSNSSKFLV